MTGLTFNINIIIRFLQLFLAFIFALTLFYTSIMDVLETEIIPETERKKKQNQYKFYVDSFIEKFLLMVQRTVETILQKSQVLVQTLKSCE